MIIVGRETLLNKPIGKVSTSYSSSIKFTQCNGEVAVILSSDAGKVTVSQQCSVDNKTWFDPCNSMGAMIGLVCLNQPKTDGLYIAYCPIMCIYMRFKIVEANVSDTNVTITVVFKETS